MIFKFYFSFVIKLADIVSKNIPNVCWESKKGNSLHIPFNGVPYLHLNRRNITAIKGKTKTSKLKKIIERNNKPNSAECQNGHRPQGNWTVM